MYCQRSPGWDISGSVPRRRIHSSGVTVVAWSGGPKPTICNSLTALWIGYWSGGPQIMPRPMRKLSRSRALIGRLAGTVSSSGPSMRFNTLRLASSGSRWSTGSSSRSLHSSSRIIVATAVIGLVIEVMRKMVSRRIGSLPPTALLPITSTCISSRRLSRVTRPGRVPRSTWPAMTWCMRSSRPLENPLLFMPCSSVSVVRLHPYVESGGAESTGSARRDAKILRRAPYGYAQPRWPDDPQQDSSCCAGRYRPCSLTLPSMP